MAKLVNQFRMKQILNESSTDTLLSQIDTHIYQVLIDMDFTDILIIKDIEVYSFKMIL